MATNFILPSRCCCAPSTRLRLVTVSSEQGKVSRRLTVAWRPTLGWTEVAYLLLPGVPPAGSFVSFNVMG